MCREGFQTGFLAGVIREACLREQETLESAVKFLPRPRQRGRSLLDHWLRPIPAKMAPFIIGADRAVTLKALLTFFGILVAVLAKRSKLYLLGLD